MVFRAGNQYRDTVSVARWVRPARGRAKAVRMFLVTRETMASVRPGPNLMQVPLPAHGHRIVPAAKTPAPDAAVQ